MESDLVICRNVIVKFERMNESVGPMSNIRKGNVCHYQAFLDQLVMRRIDRIQGVLRGIDVDSDTENIKACHRPKGKEIKERSS